jgi:hypothetical protein
LSEFLERIEREIRERLAVSRAAVREYERLEAALEALEGVGSRASAAVSRGGGGRGAPSGDAQSAPKRARAATGAVGSKTGGTARREPVGGRAGAGGRSGAKRRAVAAGGGTASARGRASRGANRAAVLAVIGERPGVSARELGAASGVTGGTLYALLRTLAERGEIDKQQLPSGHAGFTLAASPRTAASAPATDTPQDSRTDVERAPSATASAEGGDGGPPTVGDSAPAEAASGQERPEGSGEGSATVLDDAASRA